MRVKARWVYLSYELSSDICAYQNGSRIKILSNSLIKNGDVSNHSCIELSLHFGTHIDFPNHFIQSGKKSSAYSQDFFISNKIGVLNLSNLDIDNLVSITDIEKHIDTIDSNIEFLILKSGYCYKRYSDEYWNNSIGLNEGLAFFLRDKFPNLRFIGFDFISISSSNYRELGRKVHKEFLGIGLLPIEDMDLSAINQDTSIEEMIVSPLRVKGVEAAPVTVFAKILND